MFRLDNTVLLSPLDQTSTSAVTRRMVPSIDLSA